MKVRDAILGFLVATQLAACVDLSPVAYVARGRKDAMVDENDGGERDGGNADAATGALVEECRMCLATGACSAATEGCFADEKCAPFAMCMTDTSCWRERIVDFANAPKCINDCAVAAGITSQVDPAIGLFIGPLMCSQDPMQCAPACAPNLVN